MIRFFVYLRPNLFFILRNCLQNHDSMADYYRLLALKQASTLVRRPAGLSCSQPGGLLFRLEFGEFLYRGPFFLHVVEMGVYPRNGRTCMPKP